MKKYIVYCFNTSTAPLNTSPTPQGMLIESFASLKEAEDFAQKNKNEYMTIHIKTSGSKPIKPKIPRNYN